VTRDYRFMEVQYEHKPSQAKPSQAKPSRMTVRASALCVILVIQPFAASCVMMGVEQMATASCVSS
jgi:hypothetical protein